MWKLWGLALGVLVGAAACTGADDSTPPTSTSSATSGAGTGGSTSATTGSGGTSSTGTGGEGGTPYTGPTRSPGCQDGNGLDEGEHTFMLDGLSRRYVLRLPQGYTRDRTWPLVLALHGNGGSVSYWDVTSGPRNIRAVLENEAVLVIVEAIDNQWRDYGADPSTWPARIEQELVYFEEVITQMENDLCINQDAIFSMGFSGGGSFSGVLGCRRPDIRAIAVGGSVIYFDDANCIHAPAAWIAISDGDESAGRFAYRDHFRDAAGCMETSTDTTPAGCVAYDGCAAGTPVHYCDHPGGHQWPDFGAQASWDFFSAFVETE